VQALLLRGHLVTDEVLERRVGVHGEDCLRAGLRRRGRGRGGGRRDRLGGLRRRRVLLVVVVGWGAGGAGAAAGRVARVATLRACARAGGRALGRSRIEMTGGPLALALAVAVAGADAGAGAGADAVAVASADAGASAVATTRACTLTCPGSCVVTIATVVIIASHATNTANHPIGCRRAALRRASAGATSTICTWGCGTPRIRCGGRGGGRDDGVGGSGGGGGRRSGTRTCSTCIG
jgi:hypothetical protein